MRARSSYNFELEELEEIVARCRPNNVKTYITLNTLLYDHDMNLMQKIVKKAKKVGIDSMIVQDMAVIEYAKKVGMPLHISTQMSVSNLPSIKFYSKFADTIVLARELDLKMMKYICDKVKEENICGPAGDLVKIEVFIHGALCIAQSGRCQMSLLQGNASAQRGACLQECRKAYLVTDIETGKQMQINNDYVLSPKDLCALPFLDKIINTGVSILKIEGRGRTADYVHVVTSIYREAIEAIAENKFDKVKIKKWMERLKTVYNRGFCEGYYLGQALPDFTKGYSGNISTEEKTFVGLINHYFDKAKVAEINLQAYGLKKGEKIVIIGNTTGVIYEKIEKIMIDEKFIDEVKHPNLITIPISKKVRKNDKVYILKKRN